MKRLSLIGILTFLLTGYLFSQVQNKDIYEVLNQLIEINDVEILSKKAKAFDIEIPSRHEFIDWCINVGDERINLSQIDSTFIIEQVNDFTQIKWDKKKLKERYESKKIY